MKTGAVIVAAGMSSRMNDFKPLMQIGSISIIQRVITTLLQAGADPVVVVTGHNGRQLEKHLSKLKVLCIQNPEYETTQMFDSAKIGMRYLFGKCDRILFTPADVPLFTVNTVKKLMDTKAELAKPVYQGRGGHPLLLDASLLPVILGYEGPGGLKAALMNCVGSMERIEVEDEGILFDADTKEDYKMLLNYHNQQILHHEVKFTLSREIAFLDERGARLLHLIKENGSVRHACEQVNISYRKGFHMIGEMEQQTGITIVERYQGGIDGGYSKLTPQGEQLLQKYDAFVTEAVEAVSKIYNRIFHEYLT